MENRIETYNTEARAAGDIITAASVNIIQTGLDQIVSTWGTTSAGSARAVTGEVCRASLFNNWITWLKTYSSRIGATSITNSITNVAIGDLMIQSKVTQVYNATQSVKNWCNRAECNASECNRIESNTSESNSNESNNREGGN
ncbi:hypothetical protein DXA30_08160 [Fusobacterium ulcerans]|uniref:hypothetical protein n=1 Tax=Fusobacterium ulcerans TaxID=861 RepID=UPI000E4BB661|nr:hypothetical protein [Fusobacterium ulcerans]RGY64532.1 hypothetical protein DXA30_08160 [Fusobacterium ulcerans]